MGDVMDWSAVTEAPVVADYGGGCVVNLVPTLLGRPSRWPTWLPGDLAHAHGVVLLVADGLGWEQLEARRKLAPTLCGFDGGPITTVAPSTTATALTSITTGLAPGDHGVVGYRVDVDGDVLNVLRWTTAGGDARRRIPPDLLQPAPPFLGRRPAVVTKTEFATTGFTEAHLAGVRHHGYRMTSTLVVEVKRLLADGEPFVYVYYDGIDKVAHEYGLGEHYDAELGALDRLVAELCETLPIGVALVVTADHGQVEVGDRVRHLPPGVLEHVASQSGEARFRWLHAKPGASADLLVAAREAHGAEAWVVSVEEACSSGWFGPRVSKEARHRLGDVALVARADVAFDDPADVGPINLIGRHGSLTAAEMLVPVLGHLRG